VPHHVEAHVDRQAAEAAELALGFDRLKKTRCVQPGLPDISW
jgi:hypothetical protein